MSNIMPRFLTIMLIAVITAATAFAELPAEIRLPNGVTLRNIKPLRFEKTKVVVRHATGVDSVPYTNIPQPARAAFEAERDRAEKEAKVAAQAAAAHRIIDGQIFIATQGGENRMLGDNTVYAFPAEQLKRFDTYTTVELTGPIAKATTDAEGKFQLSIPPGQPFFVFCQGRRYIGALRGGDPWEHYTWKIPESEITDPKRLQLTNRNLTKPQPPVTISE